MAKTAKELRDQAEVDWSNLDDQFKDNPTWKAEYIAMRLACQLELALEVLEEINEKTNLTEIDFNLKRRVNNRLGISNEIDTNEF